MCAAGAGRLRDLLSSPEGGAAAGRSRLRRRWGTAPAHALVGLEQFSHVWLLFLFHRNRGDEVVKATKALKPTGNSEFDVTLGDLRDHLDALQTLQARLKDHRDAIQRFHATRAERGRARRRPSAPARRGWVCGHGAAAPPANTY